MKPLYMAGLVFRLLFRDRTAIFFMMVFPTVIILLIGISIFGGTGAAGDRGKVGILSSEGPLAANLVSELGSVKRFDLLDYTELETMQRDIRRETIDAAVVIPNGYDASLIAGKPVEVQFLSPTVDPNPALRTLINGVVADHGAKVKAAVFTASLTGQSPETYLQAATELAKQDPVAKVNSQTLGREVVQTIPQGFSYPAASNLVLFVFITSIAGASGLIESRRLGIVKRIISTPTTSSTVLWGFTLARFATAAFQALFIFVVGALLFRVNWGDPVGAVMVIGAFTLVGTGVGMLVGATFRTPEQASSLGPPLGIAFGMLGGTMWPLEIVPPVMRTFGHITPHAWAMDAFIDLIGRRASYAAVLPEVGVLLAVALLILTLATVRLRRTITA